jgi:hypothetical protein
LDNDAVGNKLILDTILARLDALETSALGRPRKRLSKAELAKAEGVTTRTVDRRIEQQILPPSDDVINGRHFWWSDSLERHRRKRTQADTPAARAARNPRLRKPTRAAEAR